MKTKAAATREQIYAFARKASELGYAEAGGAAVICFEWLQRPENVLAGFIRWSDYRPAEKPTFLRIEHAKTGAVVWHPLEDTDGTRLCADPATSYNMRHANSETLSFVTTTIGHAAGLSTREDDGTGIRFQKFIPFERSVREEAEEAAE